jgi:hypothetical protein
MDSNTLWQNPRELNEFSIRFAESSFLPGEASDNAVKLRAWYGI